MSQTVKDQLNMLIKGAAIIIFAISSYLMADFVGSLKADVKTILIQQSDMKIEQQVMNEKVRRIERVVDRIEDEGLKK